MANTPGPIINVSPRTILLKGRGTRDERVANEAIMPGSLIRCRSDGTFENSKAAGENIPRIFALENELFGLGIDDTYNQNDLVQAEMCGPPQWVLARVPASAAAIAVGATLQSNGDGTLVVVTSGTPLAVSMDTLNNSTSASAARIRVLVM